MRTKHLTSNRIGTQHGFTLIEIVITIVIAGILTAVALRMVKPVTETARTEETKREMETLSFAIAGNPALENNGVRSDFGYVGDVGSMPPDLDALVSNPGSYATWNGPYIKTRYDQLSSDFKQDAWTSQYQYLGTDLISTGSGTNIVRKIANSSADLLSNEVRGTIIDINGTPPGSSFADSLTATLIYPNGVGGYASQNVSVAPSGAFTFSSIPIGNHNLTAVYLPTDDSIKRFCSVIPESSVNLILKFDTAYFSTDIISSGGGGGGTVVFEEYTDAKRSSADNDIFIPNPSGTSAGDLFIAVVAVDNSTNISPPGGVGWTEISQQTQSGNITLAVYWKIATGSESATHRFTWSGNDQAYAFIMRFTNHDPSNPIDVSAANGGSGSSSPTAPSVTTTVAEALILRIGAFEHSSITVGNTGLTGHTDVTMDYSSTGSSNISAGAGYMYQVSVGASGTANFSLTASEPYRTVTIAIAPAP